MPRLRISGRINYMDGVPADGVEITIIERDLGPGGSDDSILKETTDANGRFSGLSKEWKDREGRQWGIDLPDILNLTFVVKDGNRTHKGPFVRLGDSSAPIVLPFLPRKPVPKSKRQLVQIVLLSDGLKGADRLLYRFIEESAKGLVNTVLGPNYHRITCFEGPQVTLPRFADAVETAGGAGTDAVDLMINLHGTTDKLEFADGRHTASEVAAALRRLPPRVRTTFRCVFSTACFGASHIDEWLGAGFSDAAGSERISADAQTSFAPMLGAWALEKTFAESVQAANGADPLRVADHTARAYFTARGRDADASEIDSVRRRGGRGSTRIYSTP
ncbi:transthyretin-like family protein [Kocuria flava]|nr:hypothetical protein [Kocuria flava]MCJ8504316.1 transthyretin-like family protein [Kocuria flava]MCJ8504357.1 transthyretin-like family protein [Kocuria flava]